MLWVVSLCVMTVITVVNMVNSFPGSSARLAAQAASARAQAKISHLEHAVLRGTKRMNLELVKLHAAMAKMRRWIALTVKHDKAAAGFAAAAMRHRMGGHPNFAIKQIEIGQKLRPLSKPWRALLAAELQRDKAAAVAKAH